MNTKFTALALLVAAQTAIAEDVYTVDATTTAEISLSAAGCATDRIQFGRTNENHIKHRVTDATGTLENPFTFVGGYGGYVWSTSGLMDLPLRFDLDNAESTIFLRSSTGGSGGTYNCTESKSLSFVKGTVQLSNLTLTGSAAGPALMTLGTNTALSVHKLEPLTNSVVSVVDGGRVVAEVANVSSCSVSQPAIMRIRQATVQVTQQTCQLANNSSVDPTEGDSSCIFIILEEGGVLQVPSVEHYRAPKAEIVFSGGKLKHDSSLANPEWIKPYLIHQTGTGRFTLLAETGPIVLDMDADLKLLKDDVWQGPMYLSGDRGFVKQGSGVLTMTKGSTGSIYLQVTGGVRVEGGAVRMTSACAFDPSNALAVEAGASFDLGGRDATFATLAGAGSVVSSEAAAVLTLASGADCEFAGRLGRGVTLDTADGECISMAGLKVDGDDLGATIAHFRPTAGGVLDLTLPEGVTFDDFIGETGVDLLNIGDSADEANLAQWTVRVNGAVKRAARLRLTGGKLRLSLNRGLTMVFR